MNLREKITVQIIVTVIIFCCISCIKAMDNDFAVKIKEKSSEIFSRNYTGEDIVRAAATVKTKTLEAASKVHHIVSEANDDKFFNADEDKESI